MRDGGIDFLKYRPEVAPWQFRSHRLRRLHRKLCQVDGRDRLRRRHQRHRRHEHAAAQRRRASISRCPSKARCCPRSSRRCSACGRLVQLVQNRHVATCRCFPSAAAARASARRPPGSSFATICVIAATSSRPTSPRSAPPSARSSSPTRISFPGFAFRRALVTAAERGVTVTLLLPGRVEYLLLHFATRAMYGQLLQAGIIDPGISSQHAARQGRRRRRSSGPRSARRTSIRTAC